jgi:hypothetical protein
VRKTIHVMILAVSLSISAAYASEVESMFTASFGVNFYGYDTTYLTTGVVYQVQVQEGMDFVGGADFGIHTDKDNSGNVQADFLIPLRVGLHFPFEGEKVTFGFGTGLSPCFQFSNDGDDGGFLMGPYINGTMRIQVHPVMSVFFQAQQDLLFGKPDWINTGSRFLIGISF